MARIAINRQELRNKIYGCWLGKNIGGTVGGPYECNTNVQDVKGYATLAGEPLPNDDLDLQLVWLKAVQDRGPKGINNRVLGEYWLNFIPPHWNEYGINKANQRAGIQPPLCGEYGNEKWKNSNGAWIRSEIWACLAPGCPDIAIRYAYEDASVDHGGGEGTYAALFTAALQSAAFIENDREKLFDIALSKIPDSCRVARSISIARDCHARGLTWLEARNKVVEDSQDLGWFQAPANVAFSMIGWLYGENDFGRSICIATNCGDDTDCTAATIGATLGIILGKDNIPKEWVEPIGDRIMTVAVDRGSFQPPANLSELTDQVMALCPQSLGAWNAWTDITDSATDLSAAPELPLTDQTVARAIWSKSPFAVEYDIVHCKVILDYGRNPDIAEGEPFVMRVTLVNQMPDTRHYDIYWHLPEGWSVSPANPAHTMLHNWPDMVELEFEIIAESIYEGTHRGILEVIGQGRPTVGLVPLVFFAR